MINANKPAHPFINNEDSEAVEVHYGLTKREAFAMAAMQGYIASSEYASDPENVAEYAVRCADALLTQLEHGSK